MGVRFGYNQNRPVCRAPRGIDSTVRRIPGDRRRPATTRDLAPRAGCRQVCGPETLEESRLKPTDVRDPEYFHKVVDCQYACPAHTPVPEYIRLIAAGRYTEAYKVNWDSNVFPGILGRTCDRPCEPACRRGRVEEANQDKPEPVAICRL